jgi:DNA-binding CsgD family transcriptional regulator
MQILEREAVLDTLAGALAAAAGGAGGTALVYGEAGIGKTSVVESFAARSAGAARILWGACEDLYTPRALGPLHEMALELGGELRERLETGDRPGAFAALLRELGHAGRPTIAVFEDVHWADEATLDLLKFLGRRIQRAPALLVLTYRDDELGPTHPLRSVLGELPSRHVQRLRLLPLSVGAVESLARGSGRSPEELHAVTGGNPFFVTEVLAGDGADVPASVRDAVLARLARLSPQARAVLELVSVVPARAERRLVDETLGPEPAVLEECAASGELRLGERSLAFRHELARRAVLDSLGPVRLPALHARVLQALAAREPGCVPVEQLVHHAEAAHDAGAVLRFAPAAARRAAALGAHREAAAHLRVALGHAEALAAAERAVLLEAAAYELYLTEQIDAALELRLQAARLWRGLGEPESEGRNLRWTSRLLWFLGRRAEANRRADEALALLEPLQPGRELAMARSNRAQLHMLAHETQLAIEQGTRALELAETLSDVEIQAHALNNVGSALQRIEPEAGRRQLVRSLELALEHELHEHVARAYTNLSGGALASRDLPTAEQDLRAGIEYCVERDLDSWSWFLTASRARLRLLQGDWDAAARDAQTVLRGSHGVVVTRQPALTVLGLIRARRGDPGAAEALDEARALALGSGEPQLVYPIAAARAEAAWLRGEREQIRAEAEAGYAAARALGPSFAAGELAYWMRQGGALEPAAESAAGPYASMLAGRWEEAAGGWLRLGCPYERALALSGGDDEAQRAALGIFEDLGAAAAADALRRQMRGRGVEGVPRGPRASTRQNPAGLTRRQMEVLALVAEGLGNAAIAERLCVAPKTVDHHVSAILAKLELRSRTEAAAWALAEGWVAGRGAGAGRPREPLRREARPSGAQDRDRPPPR